MVYTEWEKVGSPPVTRPGKTHHANRMLWSHQLKERKSKDREGRKLRNLGKNGHPPALSQGPVGVRDLYARV